MKISVIIPVHNEQANILDALEKISFFLERKYSDYEIIVSEDGSKDNTLKIAQEFAKKNKKIKVIHSSRKLGKGGGIIQGLKKSHGEIIAFIDADLSSGTMELEKVVNAVSTGCDIAIGSRNMKQSKIIKDRPVIRKIAAKAMNMITSTMFGLSVSDTQCGLKAINRKSLDKILPSLTKTGFEFDVELLLRAKQMDMKIKEVPITWEHRQETSKISSLPLRIAGKMGGNLIDLWIRSFFDKSDLFFFLYLLAFAAIASMFLGTSIGADEGTHLTIGAFFARFIHDYLQHPTLSFSKIYNYAISYLVHYPKLSLYYPPGFYLSFVLLSKSLGLTAFSGAFIGLIFGVATVLAVYYFGRKFIDKKTGIIAAILFSIVPIIFDLSTRAMLDIPYLLFFILSLITYLNALKSGKFRHFIYASVLFSIGFMFKQNILFLGPAVFLYCILLERKHLTKLLASFLIVALLISPYVLFLYKSGLLAVMLKSSLRVTGFDLTSPQFTTIQGWLFYPQQLGEIYLSYPLFFAAIISLMYYSWKKEKHWKLFIIWFLTFYILFTVIPNKTGRYLLPVIPVLLYPLSFYITKLKGVLFYSSFAASILLILYVSYLVLPQGFYYTTRYDLIASTLLQKEGNVLLMDEQNPWFYSSAFTFELSRQDINLTHSVLRPCILNTPDTANISAFIDTNGIRYVISSTSLDAKSYGESLIMLKSFPNKNTTVYVYENENYKPPKENCNYICITNQWVCTKYSNPADALR